MDAAEVFAKLRADFKKTFKSYPGPIYIWHDFAQPFYGCKNILSGISHTFNGFRHRNTSTITYGLALFLRGWIRLLTAPLNWLLRMPLRLMLTAVRGYQRAEHSRSVQRLVKKAEELIPLFVTYNGYCNDVDSQIIIYRHLQHYFPKRPRPKISPLLNAMVEHQQLLVSKANTTTKDILTAYRHKKKSLPTNIDIDPLPEFHLTTSNDQFEKIDYSALQFCIALFSPPTSAAPPLPPRTPQFNYSP